MQLDNLALYPVALRADARPPREEACSFEDSVLTSEAIVLPKRSSSEAPGAAKAPGFLFAEAMMDHTASASRARMRSASQASISCSTKATL